MALSGSVNTGSYDGRYYQLSWTATQSVANNQSTISWTLKALGQSGSWYAERTLKVVIAGSTVYSKTDRVERYTGTVASGTKVISHDSNGNASFSVNVQAAVFYSSVNCTGSKTFTLDTIPRKSELSVANGTLGTAQTLTVTRKSTSFSHSIKAVCGSITRYIKADGTLSTTEVKHTDCDISFTPPIDWASQNTTGENVSITYKIDTYNGSTLVGSNSYTKTCAIPASVAPTVSFTVADGADYMGWYGGFIQGKSTFNIAITASGNQGSTIRAYKTTADGKTYTSDSIISSVISGSGEMTITVVVTDSRGRTATDSKTVTVLPYTAPQITSFKAERSDSSGNPTSTGAYLKITFSSLISSVNSKNGVSYVLQFKKTGDAKYEEVELSSYTGKLSVTDGTYVFPADVGSYDLILRAADNFVVVPRQTKGASIKRLWSLLKNNRGIAFGKIAELEDTFECEFDAKFNKNVYIDKTDVGAKLEKVAHSRTIGEYAEQVLYGATGHITNSSTDVYLYIPMVWADNASNVTVSSIKATIRHVGGGYLEGAQDADLTRYLVSATLIKEQGLLYIKLRNSEGWGITNNTPLVGICNISYTVS